ncbi:hypothetical protein ASZ90_008868 [hydrocarbon metagenome]|uniref:Uncharacterized protein n=1 Tax=hydrocarbon metagenome TaxID=938273 RepID=A0A0W8FKF5_9ZZZZ
MRGGGHPLPGLHPLAIALSVHLIGRTRGEKPDRDIDIRS